MLENILKNYHENYIDYNSLCQVLKMPENRSDGTETEEERIKLGYSLDEVNREKKHLSQLLLQIKKDGFDPKAKTFIIGICDDRPGMLYLLDGQHIRVIVGILIKEGIIKPDIMLKFTINTFHTYAEMVGALAYINTGKQMTNEQISRSNSFESGECGKGYKAYMDMEEKYYGLVHPTLIRNCMFGQNNGLNVYSKPINEFHEELIKAHINLGNVAVENGVTGDCLKVVKGVQHGAVTLKDIYCKIFTNLFSKYGGVEDGKKLREYGLKLCDIFNRGLVGEFSPTSKGYTHNTVKRMLGYNGSAFKKEFKTYVLDNTVRFYSYKTKAREEYANFIKDCINEWANTK